MKVGILYPRSNAHASADIDFVDGIRQGLKWADMPGSPKLILESAGFGGSEKDVYEKAARLIRLEGVDALIAFIDLKIVPLLEPLVFAADKLMIVVNPGANYPQHRTPQPNVCYLTLQHAFLSWLAGGAAGGQGVEAAIATTFYDCGYLHGAAMVQHFMQEGGQPAYNYVNQQAYDDQFEISPLLQFLAANPGCRKLLCTFDARPAALFYNRLQEAAAQLPGQLEIFASPMMLAPEALTGPGNGFPFSIAGYLSWHAGQALPANREFLAAFEGATGRPASVFALLGWETALVIRELAGQNGDAGADAAVAGLAAAVIDSPRGALRLDPETNYFVAPVMHGYAAAGDSRLAIGPVADTDAAWSRFCTLHSEGIVSGWTNTYLCY